MPLLALPTLPLPILASPKLTVLASAGSRSAVTAAVTVVAGAPFPNAAITLPGRSDRFCRGCASGVSDAAAAEAPAW
ncbi:hypothetical protein DSM43519_03709 [Mycobacterium marinum]|nr:hypothetical protein DSM43519_03709 [Mycobacterium marinum]